MLPNGLPSEAAEVSQHKARTSRASAEAEGGPGEKPRSTRAAWHDCRQKRTESVNFISLYCRWPSGAALADVPEGAAMTNQP